LRRLETPIASGHLPNGTAYKVVSVDGFLRAYTRDDAFGCHGWRRRSTRWLRNAKRRPAACCAWLGVDYGR
jgi:hypothetical protein